MAKMKLLFQKLDKRFLILILSFLVLIFLLTSLCFLFFFKEKRIKELETKNKNLETELFLLRTLPSPFMSIPGEFEKGEVGEVSPEILPGLPLDLPSVIFNTSGIISEVKEQGLIVQGDGSNFADRKPRELTLLFTLETITFEPGQKRRHQELEGLKHLKQGDVISISSPENIRGKTQFKVDYINKL